VARAIEDKGYSRWRACALIGLKPKTYRCSPRRPDDADVLARLSGRPGVRSRAGPVHFGL